MGDVPDVRTEVVRAWSNDELFSRGTTTPGVVAAHVPAAPVGLVLATVVMASLIAFQGWRSVAKPWSHVPGRMRVKAPVPGAREHSCRSPRLPWHYGFCSRTPGARALRVPSDRRDRAHRSPLRGGQRVRARR
ncbi:hypothetical protein FOV72_13995 [Gordonia rubripertincta]|nr:hypothetical protein FOV72_13995 [Gordonia rubripertincta]